MKFLVTGAAGFIGSHTCEALLMHHQVVGIDNFDQYYSKYTKRENIGALLMQQNFSFEELDILDIGCLNRLVKTVRPDIIIHLAARAGVRPSVQFPQKYIDTNVTGTLNVLQACAEAKVKKLVFASSSSVYGSSLNGPCKEDQLVSPLNVYAASKVAGEALCHSFSQFTGLETVCLRFFTVYGPRQRPDMAISKFVRLISASEPIEIRGGPLCARDYTYIDDIVSGITSVAEIQLPTRYEVLNLGSSQPILLTDLIKELGSQLEVHPIVNHVSLPREEAEITHADVSKAKTLVGYCPSTSLKEGVAQYVKWFTMHGVQPVS